MMRAVFFFIACILLASILYFFPVIKTPEGFKPASECDKDLVQAVERNLSTKEIVPDLAQAGVGVIEASTTPNSLPLAPIELRAKGAPLPYRDPSTEPAKYIRIRGLIEDLQAFLAYDADNLTERCDPSIQLPLTGARTDLESLRMNASVMDRNPGIASSITNRDIMKMTDNLNYLKAEVNKLVANHVIEGFAATETRPATKDELIDFDTRLLVEKLRIGAAGTTDPNVIGRLSTFEKLHEEVSNIIDQLNSGVMLPADVPITKADIDSALPILGDMSKPLPQVLEKANIPRAILNLFPGGLSASDTATLNAFRKTIDTYAKQITKKLGATDSFVDTTTSSDEYQQTSDAILYQQIRDATLSLLNGFFQNNGSSSRLNSTQSLPGMSESENPGFDWEERALLIANRVKTRGLNPEDYGIISDDAEVTTDFSWRGYTRMICSRLMADVDPGLPEACGCPPYNWNGWTS